MTRSPLTQRHVTVSTMIVMAKLMKDSTTVCLWTWLAKKASLVVYYPWGA